MTATTYHNFLALTCSSCSVRFILIFSPRHRHVSSEFVWFDDSWFVVDDVEIVSLAVGVDRVDDETDVDVEFVADDDDDVEEATNDFKYVSDKNCVKAFSPRWN